MDVYEFCSFALDDYQNVILWSIDAEKVVFEGSYYDAKYSEYADEEVQSFDISNNILTINI